MNKHTIEISRNTQANFLPPSPGGMSLTYIGLHCGTEPIAGVFYCVDNGQINVYYSGSFCSNPPTSVD